MQNVASEGKRRTSIVEDYVSRFAQFGNTGFIAILVLCGVLPFVSNDYWALIATRAAIYWVLVSGLNLVVGYAGQLAIGYVALLTLGAYTTSVLAAGNVLPALPSFIALLIAGGVGSVFGVIVGLPALRLRTFYFAMSTLGFATIVTQIALAWQNVTGGGIGIVGPEFPAPFNTPWGFYALCILIAIFSTWVTHNIAHSQHGRALVAIRDAEVAAEACGIYKPYALIKVFIVAGMLAGVSGGLFATLQTYITPDAFTFELSVLFFISILIGGRGSILGPMLGTIILTLLPEVAAPLAAWSNFLYAVLLLIIVLVVPGGIGALIDFKNKRPLGSDREIVPQINFLNNLGLSLSSKGSLVLKDIDLRFGALYAINGLSLEVHSGQVHGLIGPNGSGKTTTLNAISGYYAPNKGEMKFWGAELVPGLSHLRTGSGIARTFQTPKIVGEASVIDNVMIGAVKFNEASFIEVALALPRHKRDEARLRAMALDILSAVGLRELAYVRADRLQHSELRFVEIARALISRPKLLMLDEPAAGLSVAEIGRLGEMIKAISKTGVAVLLVEHHADLIFDICDYVTVLNFGKALASGSPDAVRSNKEVVSAYLGS
jgi:branched-chain amino acid transport system ATP-binding protein/branched-chain amino acid transport system permease protein